MISYDRRTVKNGKDEFEFRGMSTDTKPVGEYDGRAIANGSVFVEIDSGAVLMYDEGNESWKAW